MTARLPRVGRPETGASLMVAWQLRDRRVLVVGGGSVAAGRAALALDAGADVIVVAPRLSAALQVRVERGELSWEPRPFEASDCDGAVLVLSAVDDADVSLSVAQEARRRRIPVNVADVPELCDIWLPAVHRDGPVQIAVATNGEGPSLARRLKDHLVAALPDGAAEATRRFGRLRRAIRAATPQASASPRRMAFLGEIGRMWSWERLATLEDADIERIADRFARTDTAEDRAGGGRPDRVVARGRVTLVGAGPGDPSLLTVAARDAIAEADLVVADRIVSPEILALVTGELRIARKLKGRADRAQAELDGWVLAAVAEGRSVVRLKCGDPFLFGRGGEEIETLARHGVDATVIPGVTSALSAPLAVGIPATHRDVADRVLILTGQGRGGRPVEVPDFDPGTTVVLLMAMERLDDLARRMILAGFPTNWPAAVIERGARDGQRAIRGPLHAIAGIAEARGLAAPATVVVGRVVCQAASPAFEVDHRDPAEVRVSA